MNVEALISGTIIAVIGLAIVAVLVSPKAGTAKVIGASGNSLANVIAAAVSPVTGNSSRANTGGGGGGFGPGGLFDPQGNPLPGTVFGGAFGASNS